MCGIVGAVAQRDVAPILIEGLRRLEYRGYDSAGVAVLDPEGAMQRRRVIGKVQGLADSLAQAPLRGGLGIAHTRWATHGVPSERNAHPHVSGDASLALVHNGIIENFAELRAAQVAAGYRFESDTDTEVIVHAIDGRLSQGADLLQALLATLSDLKGAYALAICRAQEPERLVVARSGSPLVIGIGIGENFVASDVYALLPVTQRVLFLEEGDVAEVTRTSVRVFDRTGVPVEREVRLSGLSADAVERGEYRHYMIKEIHEQPRAINDTLEGRLLPSGVAPEVFGIGADALFARIQAVQIVACGTSFHAGSVARYWIEKHAGLPCQVEVASEFRYRTHAPWPNTLFVTISQSGETADTLAALRLAKEGGYLGTLAICNVPESSLVRESGLCLLTHAGPEIGVASTKAFTTQLTALLLLTLSLQRIHRPQASDLAQAHEALRGLPGLVERVLKLDQAIQHLAERFNEKHHALFLGRGEHYPVAMEGALKLKEISYIHAEAYPAGELKHGPLALIDEEMPVIAVAPDNALLEKLKSNLEEVKARGGELIVFADARVRIGDHPALTVIHLPEVDELLAPIAFTLPLQLLAYYVALLKGTDVDQPRNLAKAVTVE